MPVPVPDSAGNYLSVPVTITAAQWDGTEEHASILCAWADSYRGRGSAVYLPAGEPVELYGQTLEHPARIAIGTLEGTMKLEPGAWLIKGTEDEFYPCKDSVFQRKYAPQAAAGTLVIPRELTAGTSESSFQLSIHPYAQNSFLIEHFTGSLMLSREDLEEAYRQLDNFLYPNPGYPAVIAGRTNG